MIQRIVSISLLVCGLAVTAAHCGREQQMMVTAESGLILRETPSADGKAIATIPHGTAVTVTAATGPDVTIAGRTGKWSQVSWNRQKGWAFGGFLKPLTASKADANPDKSDGWGAYQGKANFITAEAKCETAGMHLPTPEQLQSAVTSGLATSWERPSTANYWSSGHRTPESIIAISIDTGKPPPDMFFHATEVELPFRCIR